MALCVCVSTRSLVVIQCCEPRCFSLRFFFFFSFFFLFFLPRSAKNSVLASTISLFVSCTSFIPARIPCFACTHLPTEVSKTRKHFQRAYKFYSSDILTSRRLNCFFSPRFSCRILRHRFARIKSTVDIKFVIYLFRRSTSVMVVGCFEISPKSVPFKKFYGEIIFVPRRSH